MAVKTSWAGLGRRARAWRVVHAIWSVLQLAGLAEIWRAAIRRQPRGATWAAVGFLLVEGGGLAIGRGNCPAGRIQERWGDPVPFFELVLPPRAAKAAVPVLAVISIAGLIALAARRPRPAAKESQRWWATLGSNQ